MCIKECTNLLSAAAVALALTACGSSSDRRIPVQTGVLGIVPIAGVAYRTATQSGTTNRAGEFSYKTGETVTFDVAALDLGSAGGANRLSLFDLQNVPLPADQQELLNYYATNPYQDMQRAIHYTVLLQTLDTDADTTNGIEISPAIADRLFNKSINVNQSGTLHNDRRMRELLYEAADAGELTTRPVKHTGLALAAVWDLDVYQYLSFRRDTDADGSDDFAQRNSYNPQGRIIESDVDSNGDGIFDARNEYTYNSNLQSTSTVADADFDGVADGSSVREYNEHGSLVRSASLDASGGVISESTQVWDAQGALVRRENLKTNSHTIEYWHYTDGVRDTYEKDDDADGVIDRRDTFTFDARGNWLTRSEDHDLDGTPDVITTREFDADERETRIARDDGADGTIDEESLYTFDTFGNSVSQTHYIGGALASQTESVYNARGLRTELRIDSDGDGIWNAENVYVRDDRGYIVEQQNDTDGDGTFDWRRTSDINELGQLEVRVDETNGVTSRRVTHIYDGLQLTETRVDDSGDGTIDRVSFYSDYVAFPVSSWF